jgi:8-amino-7-oxononanoate synthase
VADPWQWLEDDRAVVRARGLQRSTAVAPDGLLDLASNDYLGLARHPAVVEAAVQAARRSGTGATGSRLVTGTHDLHLALEGALAERTGAASALVFSSGYLANLGAVTTLADRDTLVVSDAANHASLVDACRLSRARVQVVPHGDVTAVERALDAHTGRAVVVTDAVFSVDGSLAPLVALHDAVRAAGALLLVDEAHALGVLGPRAAGACAAAGLDAEADVVRTVTLSKALGSQGGAVLGPAALRDHLVDTCRSFIFDTALAPPAAAAALAALDQVTDERVAALSATTAALSAALDVRPTPGPVVRVPASGPAEALEWQQRCLAAGVRVGCFRPPSVPEDGSCLRLTARAALTASQVEHAAAVVLAERPR